MREKKAWAPGKPLPLYLAWNVLGATGRCLEGLKKLLGRFVSGLSWVLPDPTPPRSKRPKSRPPSQTLQVGGLCHEFRIKGPIPSQYLYALRGGN